MRGTAGFGAAVGKGLCCSANVGLRSMRQKARSGPYASGAVGARLVVDFRYVAAYSRFRDSSTSF
jgi:hypothetical protein